MKGNSTLLWVAVILVVLLVAGVIPNPFAASGVTGGGRAATTTTQGSNCPDSGQTNLKIAVRNPLNSTLDYLGATGYVVYQGDSMPVGTVTGAATGLGSAVSFTCGKTADLYILGDTNVVSASLKGINLLGASVEKYITAPRSSDLQFLIYNDAYQEINGSTTYYKDVTVPATAITFNSGDSKTYTMKVQTAKGSAQFGSDEVDNYIGIDYNTAKFSSANGVVITGDHVISEVTCPAYAYAQGMDKCYKIKPIKSSEGTVTFTLSLKADLGDPGDTDDVKIQFYDGNYYQGADGSIKAGIGNDANGAIGQTDRYVTINLT